ncbi:HlyD family efflux transporter periplasmic adaptor subunit [uncultured Roseobacter sp.]|uniref:HlyD family efflux transporter periplasmic adaptor subunit n=1 Tax=uncultured Roseobacter sp. TaxID=114847 RepID=UPI0026027B0D|nr:HlyD family efflux transporter periplasmic adaptor subunit [uncultured Roseobacter sp.]
MNSHASPEQTPSSHYRTVHAPTVPAPDLTTHSALDEVRDSGAARLTVAACSASVAFALVWAAQVIVEEKVTGTGTIETRGQVERIEHPDGGVVETLVASDNAIIDAGEILLRFDTSHLERESLALAARIDTLENEAERVRFLLRTDGHDLPADRITGDAGSEAFWAEQVFLIAQLDRIQSEDTRIAAQIRSAVARARIIREEQEIVEKQLVRFNRFSQNGTVRLIDRERLEREALQLRRSIEETEARRIDLEATRRENALHRGELLAQRRRDAAVRWTKINEELVSLRQAAADADARIRRAEVRSAIGGQISRLEVLRSKEVVAPGDIIAEIVPPDVEYRAVVDISADRIGAIREGMDVRLKVTSYDFTRFGAIEAQVTEVSPTSFVTGNGDVVYRVTVNLPDTVPTGNDSVAVRPGMTVTADILTGERSVLSYLLHPVRRIQDQSLSET